MVANNFDFSGGAMHARHGWLGSQEPGLKSDNNPKFVGEGVATVKYGESGGNQPGVANENRFAGNAGKPVAPSGNS
jgi:hypothetical protein